MSFWIITSSKRRSSSSGKQENICAGVSFVTKFQENPQENICAGGNFLTEFQRAGLQLYQNRDSVRSVFL